MLLYFLLAPAALSASNLVQAAATGFNVPTFTSQQLLLEADDLIATEGDETGPKALEGQVALSYTRAGQSPSTSYTVGSYLGSYLLLVPRQAIGIASEGNTAASYTRYLTGPRGVFVNGHGSVAAGGVANQPATLDTTLGAAVGYGRVVDARTVAQAAKMYEILDREYDAEDLLRVAEVIGQRSAYVANYRFDSDIYFFRDVGEALGGTSSEEMYRLQQVLDSPLYNIGSRFTGREISFGVDTAAGDLASRRGGGSTFVGASAKFGVIVGESSILVPIYAGCAVADNAVQTLTTPLPDGCAVGSNAALSVDHTPSWNTVLSGGARFNFDPESGRGLSLERKGAIATNMALGSKLVWTAKAEVSSTRVRYDSLEWAASSAITYFIF